MNDEIQVTEIQVTEMRVGGRNVNPFAPAVCQHRSFSQQVVGAVIVDDNGAISGRQFLLKLRCAECGIPMKVRHETARPARDEGVLGIVVDVEPGDRHDEGWTPTIVRNE